MTKRKETTKKKKKKKNQLVSVVPPCRGYVHCAVSPLVGTPSTASAAADLH